MDNIIDTFQISKKNIDNHTTYIENDHLDIDEDSTFVLKKKKLIEYSKNLTQLEYNEIFSMIKNDECDYSSNINGVFINLSNINEKTIDKIFNFLKFTKQKKKELKEKEFYIEDFKKNIKHEDIKINKTQFNISNNETHTKYEDDYENELSSNEDSKDLDKYLCFSSDDE